MVVFFFQAEDGIRDIGVTGVQTCALPIFRGLGKAKDCADAGIAVQDVRIDRGFLDGDPNCPYENRFEDSPPKLLLKSRSEERRVGKECISGGWQYQIKKKQL